MALRCLARLSLLAGAAALPTYDSEGNLQTDFFDRGVAPAAAGKSSHLKVMTFYGGTADELHGWANVMRDSIDACDNKTITEKWKMKILVELGAEPIIIPVGGSTSTEEVAVVRQEGRPSNPRLL